MCSVCSCSRLEFYLKMTKLDMDVAGDILNHLFTPFPESPAPPVVCTLL